jgi:hypothetical protein
MTPTHTKENVLRSVSSGACSIKKLKLACKEHARITPMTAA